VRLRFPAVVAATLALLLGTGTAALAAPPASSSSSGPTYYLALGDSLAQGVQPNSSGVSAPTNHGYVDDLYAVYRRQVPGLQLVKLGCPGETTQTMRSGVCPYSGHNQLAAAVNFLTAHRGHIFVVTLDIGANNVTGCVSATGVTDCRDRINAAGADLKEILKTLRGAYPGPIVGMNYYDPYLAAWRQVTAGPAIARASVRLTNAFNSVLESAYTTSVKPSVPVADVSAAFFTNTFTMLPVVNLPLNVATICLLTWMCAPVPVGPNIHPRSLGYLVIAGAFLKVGLPRTGSPG